MRRYLSVFIYSLIIYNADMNNAKNFSVNQSKSPFVHDMFDGLAADYDSVNNMISLGLHTSIKKAAIRRIPLKPGSFVIDLCTGTGDIAKMLADMYGESIQITAVDFSESMISLAKINCAGHKNISFVHADIFNLPFADHSFDAAFISFGLRNLSDIKKGLRTLYSITKKNGVVVNIDFGKPPALLKHLFEVYLSKIVPFCAKIVYGSPQPFYYLYDSYTTFPHQTELVRMFEETGFRSVTSYTYLFGSVAQQVAIV